MPEIKLQQLELRRNKKIDRKTIKMLTMYKGYHPKVDNDRLYRKRKGRERGLLQIEVRCKAAVMNIAKYLNVRYKEGQFVSFVKSTEALNRI
jgi:hypothetical protein